MVRGWFTTVLRRLTVRSAVLERHVAEDGLRPGQRVVGQRHTEKATLGAEGVTGGQAAAGAAVSELEGDTA